MDNLILFDQATLNSLLQNQSVGTKFGEHVQLLPDVLNIYEQLNFLDVEFVILGIPKIVELFANQAKLNTRTTWDDTIKILLNTQNNCLNKANKTLILGQINCLKEQKKLEKLDLNIKSDFKKARKLITKIDKKVSFIISQIVKANKIPIVIGGGQNNAYGIIKGIALAKNKAINALNFDSIADFDKEESKYSGNNGFNYAYAEGFLKKYFVFGVNKNKCSPTALTTIKKLKRIKYNTLQAIKVNEEAEMQKALTHIFKKSFGVEINYNSIKDTIDINYIRRFISFFGKEQNACYLHIYDVTPEKQQETIDESISCFIIDFITSKTLEK